MLKTFSIVGFKSLREVSIEFAPITVFFGPNGSGKSNIVDAIHILSQYATGRTLSDAFRSYPRGIPLESFTFIGHSIADNLKAQRLEQFFSAELMLSDARFCYELGVEIAPASGNLSIYSENLYNLHRKTGDQFGIPKLETKDKEIHIRTKQGRPRKEPLHQNHTKLSDARLGGNEYAAIRRCREDFTGWRIHYFDPRIAMREAIPPLEVHDVGVIGEYLAPFIYRLKNSEHKRFIALKRTIKSVIPSISDLNVELDERRGTLDVFVEQYGREYSSRIVSEGTLRVLALCCIAVNPWGGSLVGIEEPENGVHPSRIDLVAKLIKGLASSRRQIVISTHSPLFCEALLHECGLTGDELSMYRVFNVTGDTEIEEFKMSGPLFDRAHIDEGLRGEEADVDMLSLMRQGFF